MYPNLINFFLLFILVFGEISSPPLKEDEKWKSLHIDDLIEQRNELQRPYLRFLDEPSMSMGLYALDTGTVDQQNPHQRDEVYYIVGGKAVLKIAEDETPVAAGSIVYVKAEVPHKFEDISEDLLVLVIFPKTDFNPNDPDWLSFELDNIRKKQDPEKNVWNPFLNVTTMRFGLYLLPQKLGGDSTLMHKVDEVNIVVKGKSKFRMDEDEIDVEPGAIVYVKEGVGHYFHTLSEDFEVLILFEKRT